MLFKYHGSNECNECVAVYRFTLAPYDGRAIDIGVEDHAEVGAAVLHCLAYRSHGVAVLGIGDVVGEVSVRFKELAALCVGTERTQYLLEESAVAVSCIHNDVHAFKRMRVVVGFHAFADVVGDMARIDCHEVECRCVALRPVEGVVAALCNGENGGNVLAVESALGGEELQSVAVEGQMACRHHDRSRGIHLLADGGHEHGRG